MDLSFLVSVVQAAGVVLYFLGTRQLINLLNTRADLSIVANHTCTQHVIKLK